jgi:hypothetical protein
VRVLQNLSDDIGRYRRREPFLVDIQAIGQKGLSNPMDQGLLLGLLSAGVIVLFLIGVPIFLVIGYWVVGASLIIDFTLANVGVTLFEGLNFFGLLSLPLFILTGDLIAAAGIARRLADFAHACLSWLRGGLGLATLGSCGLFAAISGSNSATTATIGGIMHPLLVKDGYDSALRRRHRRGRWHGGHHHPAVDHLHRLRLPDEPVDLRPVRRRHPARAC